jgi:hypothetical protein
MFFKFFQEFGMDYIIIKNEFLIFWGIENMIEKPFLGSNYEIIIKIIEKKISNNRLYYIVK